MEKQITQIVILSSDSSGRRIFLTNKKMFRFAQLDKSKTNDL
jgi:hypothetical protein